MLLFLVGKDSAFCSLDLVVISCLLLLVAVLGLSGLAGSAHFAVLGLWVTRGIVFECACLPALRAKYADFFTATTDTMRALFAQRDHTRVFHCVNDCLNMMNA